MDEACSALKIMSKSSAETLELQVQPPKIDLVLLSSQRLAEQPVAGSPGPEDLQHRHRVRLLRVALLHPGPVLWDHLVPIRLAQNEFLPGEYQDCFVLF